MNQFKNICIYGMGLMGTSLAYSLKQHPEFNGTILGIVKTIKSKNWIENNNLVDKVYISDENNWEEILNSDIIIIGLPVLNTIEFLKEISQKHYKGIITDMSSTRYELEKQVRILEDKYDLRFIGSHPMCGSEVSGPEGYVKNLFLNKLCIVIDRLEENQEIDRNKEDLYIITNFWKKIGMHILSLDAKTHDYILSYLSHSPHILSSILATIIGKQKTIIETNNQSPLPILGGGLRDMIRIAGSNPKMWFDIIATNKSNILKSLKDFKNELNQFIEELELFIQDDRNNFEHFWYNWQNQSKIYRDEIYGNKNQ